MTHHHFDHILGSAGFLDAISYAAPPVAAALTGGLDAVRAEALSYGADAEQLGAVRAPDHLVWQTEIDLGGLVVQISHPGAGHTDHDLVVAIPSGPPVIFCGDLVEESADPAIGPDAAPVQWPDALDRVLGLGGDDAVYVPGHGSVVDADYVRQQRDWLRSRF